ncbi:hypothetical protein BYT27DRAFT_7248172 [Phlegmacium glaucopus]|nr:hypothetical protein BYT27DRAFT_7248172 [Phlegmacium glaucopus]
MAHMTPTKICEALVGFDDQVWLGVEEGNIHTTMQHIGRRLRDIFALQLTDANRGAFRGRLYLYSFLRSWNQQEERLAPNFVARQQAALLEFDQSAPVSQPGIRSPMRPGAPAPVAIPARGPSHARAAAPAQVAAPTRMVASKPKAANVTPASRQPQQSRPAAGAPATHVPTDPRTAPTALASQPQAQASSSAQPPPKPAAQILIPGQEAIHVHRPPPAPVEPVQSFQMIEDEGDEDYEHQSSTSFSEAEDRQLA